MVSKILGTENIDRKLEELTLEKTVGIPFFIEEFMRSLKDLGIIQRKEFVYCLAKDIAMIAIPNTIQDVVMARVDSLHEAAKAVLQTGSVIEREFSYELMKRVTGLSERELLSHLSALRDSELLYEKGIYPQSTYMERPWRWPAESSPALHQRVKLGVGFHEPVAGFHLGHLTRFRWIAGAVKGGPRRLACEQFGFLRRPGRTGRGVPNLHVLKQGRAGHRKNKVLLLPVGLPRADIFRGLV